MRGRKPHPTAIKLLHDNPSRRPLNEREPQHATIAPKVPKEIATNKLAAAEWRRVVGMLGRGHVTEVDRAVLILYCLKYAQWQALEVEASLHPFLVRAPSNYPMPNPALGMANKACAIMLKAAVELGITPSARSRIVLAAHEQPPNALDEFTAYQRRRLGVH